MENILNIINFIRGAEPRDRNMDLVKPVREQIRLMKVNNLQGTFLLMYDAMLREDILELLRPLDPKQFELGLWLEMSQPHVEAAGLTWRGRPGFEWDWHANVGFSVGYPPKEREKLVDVLIERYETCFHRRPKSVGSWLIDAHTLAYLSDHHGIIASCNCKDQWGTDGYTIWGGYWNQGYYPSRSNALCPAQTDEKQIPIPVLRMLGSDPVSQYDLGLNPEDGATELQQVASLEPVYGNVGGDGKWVDWFMRQNFSGGSLAFAYAQAGQENSFGWVTMEKGLEYQFPLFAKWRDERGLRVERLEDTGRWFRRQFAHTPATSVSALEPYEEHPAQSVWYDCKYYRVNLYRDAKGLRIRDLFLFDEDYEERYIHNVCTTEYLVYDNLPIMDGNRMSGGGILAGGWLTDRTGKETATSAMTVEEKTNGLRIHFGCGAMEIGESGLHLMGETALQFRWNAHKTDFRHATQDCLLYEHNGMQYALAVIRGRVVAGDQPLLLPEAGELWLKPLRMGKTECNR